MMKNKQAFLVRLTGFILAACIPALLALAGIQARRFSELEAEISRLEKTQAELVEENRRLITDISILSGSDRIETIAIEELGMRKAETGEIVRVEMKAGN
ncbi:MAG: septum formation initiator family protein [Treponema sp.]|jgi:cell division protein FtsL|nr:septum formation initiator family protein [Treponema sp.]